MKIRTPGGRPGVHANRKKCIKPRTHFTFTKDRYSLSTINDKKPQLHASMLTMFSNCPLAFQRRYGARFGLWHEEEIRPPGIAAAIGSSVDAAVNYSMIQKMDLEGGMPKLESVLQVARDEAAGMWSGGLLLSDEEADSLKQTQGDLIDWSVMMSEHHYNEVADLIKPLDVQKNWVITLENFPVDLSGTIDIVEPGQLRDTKTTKGSVPYDFAHSMQAVIYNLAFKIETGQLPKEFIFDVLVRKDLKRGREVDYKPATLIPQEKHFPPLFNRIERLCDFFENVRKGKATFPAVTPSTQSKWICSKAYCGYWPTCNCKLDW